MEIKFRNSLHQKKTKIFNKNVIKTILGDGQNNLKTFEFVKNLLVLQVSLPSKIQPFYATK